MRKYGESKTTRIMMATVPHVISGLGLRKFQADWFLLTRVYIHISFGGRLSQAVPQTVSQTARECIKWLVKCLHSRTRMIVTFVSKHVPWQRSTEGRFVAPIIRRTSVDAICCGNSVTAHRLRYNTVGDVQVMNCNRILVQVQHDQLCLWPPSLDSLNTRKV